MPFKNGASGNPGGRKRASATFEVRQLAQKYTDEAITRLVHWMRQDVDPKVSLQATIALIERGWGNALSHTEAEILTAKLALLDAGTNPDDTKIEVTFRDYTKKPDGVV